MKPLVFAVSVLAALAAGCAGCTDPPPVENNGVTNNTPNNGAECAAGERTCQDTRTLATCARSGDGSLRLVTTTCLDSEECRDGDCVDLPRMCDDTCTPPETRCTPTGDVETCSDHNGDGCNEFGAARACDPGQICDPADGLCKMSSCTDQCTEGQTNCEDTLITTCAMSAMGCLDWGPAKECPEGQVCSNGACGTMAGCEDECNDGETTCTGDGMLRTCATDVDADACTEFTTPESCPGTDVCRNGECVAANSCRDLCLAGEKVCVGNKIASCEMNAEGCLEFTNEMDCPGANESCQNTGGNVACAPVMMTGKVVINEIFYDALGDDYRGASDGTPTFIELFGPPGLPIGNYTIELVNGSGGSVYGSFQLPADAQLDGNGFAVVGSDEPDVLIGFVLPFFTNVYYLLAGASGSNDVMQNGPDNVRLLDDSGVEVDAIAYGDFSSTNTFAGEGSCANPPTDCDAAPDVIGGRSIGRDPQGTDTNNNKADLLSYYPTPSLPNSDLIINEVYFDQPGTDDGTETFVELMAPILGWEDLPLDGYVLHAINGFDGMDYIFTGILPGIDMSGWFLNEGFGEDGYVVTCNIDTASTNLLTLCTVPYEGVDFQNGPDNFVLRYEGRVIDAVGYGSFGAQHTFSGEGTAATWSSSDGGKSLSRWPIYDVSRDLDTDNNSNDFFKVSPTPGADNELP